MGARLPTYRLMTRNRRWIASWLVVMEYRLHIKETILTERWGLSGGAILKF